MSYENKVLKLPYCFFTDITKRKLPLVLCFNVDKDEGCENIRAKANILCCQYQNVDCYCTDWTAFQKKHNWNIGKHSVIIICQKKLGIHVKDGRTETFNHLFEQINTKIRSNQEFKKSVKKSRTILSHRNLKGLETTKSTEDDNERPSHSPSGNAPASDSATSKCGSKSRGDISTKGKVAKNKESSQKHQNLPLPVTQSYSYINLGQYISYEHSSATVGQSQSTVTQTATLVPLHKHALQHESQNVPMTNPSKHTVQSDFPGYKSPMLKYKLDMYGFHGTQTTSTAASQSVSKTSKKLPKVASSSRSASATKSMRTLSKSKNESTKRKHSSPVLQSSNVLISEDPHPQDRNKSENSESRSPTNKRPGHGLETKEVTKSYCIERPSKIELKSGALEWPKPKCQIDYRTIRHEVRSTQGSSHTCVPRAPRNEASPPLNQFYDISQQSGVLQTTNIQQPSPRSASSINLTCSLQNTLERVQYPLSNKERTARSQTESSFFEGSILGKTSSSISSQPVTINLPITSQSVGHGLAASIGDLRPSPRRSTPSPQALVIGNNPPFNPIQQSTVRNLGPNRDWGHINPKKAFLRAYLLETQNPLHSTPLTTPSTHPQIQTHTLNPVTTSTSSQNVIQQRGRQHERRRSRSRSRSRSGERKTSHP